MEKQEETKKVAKRSWHTPELRKNSVDKATGIGAGFAGDASSATNSGRS